VNRHRRHQCPTCTCDGTGRVVIDPSAPFYGLVVAIDRLIWDDYYARRTATRRAHRLTRSTS
jgi:hypothetical protein